MSVCRNAPSMFIYDNSYVKCREITLSYRVPKTWLNNLVSDLTLSFVARNPFIVWTQTIIIQQVWDWNMVHCHHVRAMASM